MDIKVIGPEADSTRAVKTERTGPILGMEEEDFAKLAGSIIVMIPHRTSEGINANLSQNIGYWSRFGTSVATCEDQFAGFVEMTRSGMVRTFREYRTDRPNIEYCVMIDSDEAVPWDAPYRLAAWNLGVVSGVICSYSATRGIFACFTVKDEYGVARFPSWNYTRTIPGRGLIEAHTVGTGLLCVKGQVFDALEEAGEIPFVIPESERIRCYESGVLRMGEDTAFSRQCEKINVKRHVDLSVRGTHYKTVGVEWPSAGIDMQADVSKWKVDGRDYYHA